MRIKFKRDTSFRKQFFVPDSFAHPAKMDAQLLIWIVEHYSQEGETILDPMAGSGTTMLACTLGRNVVLVELEQKFIRMALSNRRLVYMKPQLGYGIGECPILWGDARDILRAREHPYEDLWLKYPKLDYATIKAMRRHYNLPLKGDARQLEGLCDKVITSPPFFNTNIKKKFKSEKEIEEFAKKTKLYKEGRSLEAIVRMIKKNWNANEGLLVDKIVSSPPYSDMSMGGGLNTQPPREGHNDQAGRSPQSPSQEGAGGYVDKIVTSPPYSEGLGHQHRKYGRDIEASKSIQAPEYSRSPDNIGNLVYGQIDKIVTSPPYEDYTCTGSSSTAKEHNIGQSDYGNHPSQIGNLKSQSYLEAMLQVYHSCYSVLRAGGLMVLVTKNFIRNKQVIRLDTDTIKLCEQAGFSFVERHYRELPAQSFWRVIYHDKFPDVEQILNEDVLVFKKCLY